MSKLTHLDELGAAHMVDVGGKPATERLARAGGTIRMSAEALSAIKAGDAPKGDVLGTARIAGIMGVKKTPDLIPMCHQLLISGIDVTFEFEDNKTIGIWVKAKNTGKTGVEMEALTGVSVAALTIYDMCKAVDREMVIGEIKLMKKTGGKSGEFIRRE